MKHYPDIDTYTPKEWDKTGYVTPYGSERPTAFQNFRYDVSDCIYDHAALLLTIVLVAIIIGSHQ